MWLWKGGGGGGGGESRNSLVGLLQEVWPVADGEGHETHVDEVEGAGAVDPVGFDVVDFEGDVGWDPGIAIACVSIALSWNRSPASLLISSTGPGDSN